MFDCFWLATHIRDPLESWIAGICVLFDTERRGQTGGSGFWTSIEAWRSVHGHRPRFRVRYHRQREIWVVVSRVPVDIESAGSLVGLPPYQSDSW